MPQLFNVCSKKVYEKNGEKKVKWYNVGMLKITDGGKRYLHLFLFPQTEFYLFEKEENLPEVQIGE